MLARRILTVITFSLLLSACGFHRGPESTAAWLGKVTIEECIYWEKERVKKCTEIESNGFTGWGAVDAVLGAVTACITTGKCW